MARFICLHWCYYFGACELNCSSVDIKVYFSSIHFLWTVLHRVTYWELCIVYRWPSLATWVGFTLLQLAQIDLSCVNMPLNTKWTNNSDLKYYCWCPLPFNFRLQSSNFCYSWFLYLVKYLLCKKFYITARNQISLPSRCPTIEWFWTSENNMPSAFI